MTAVPLETTSEFKMDALNCTLLTKTVVRVDPFHWTTAPFKKFVPVNVNVNAGSPTLAFVGLIDERVGGGMTGALIEKDWGPEVPPGAELNTVTAAVPDEMT